MKQKQITLDHCELLVVELPEGASPEQFGISEQLKHLGAVNDVTEGVAVNNWRLHFDHPTMFLRMQ